MTPHEPASFRFLCRILGESSVGGVDEASSTRCPAMSVADWDEILWAAQIHRLSPLLYDRLGTAGQLAPAPERVRAALHQDLIEHTARNAIAYHELGRIVEALSREGIPVITLKGAFLAASVYEQIGHRPMGDLDLLVPRPQLMAATTVVQRLGYDYTYPGDTPVAYTAEKAQAIADRHKHVPRLFKPRGFAVEMHWNLVVPDSGWNVDLSALWERSRPVSLGTIPVRTLAPEDLLLHICLHAVGGNSISLNIGLRPFCDIAAVVRRYGRELEWSQVQSRAHAWQAGNAVAVALSLAKALLGVAVPEDCLISLRSPDFDPHWEDWARRQVWTSAEKGILRLPSSLTGPLQKVGRLTAAPSPNLWRQTWAGMFGTGGNSLNGSPVGSSTSEARAVRRRERLQRFKRMAAMFAFAARRPREAWFLVQTFRADAHFRAWLRQEASRGQRSV